ncbi:elongation factor P hydroxylase [Legionella jordanis]|uniref:elongation factor P hydroxylase n=1 Tax=Legionella jordanis TaxID=456 RepID=UPI00072FA913|nr:elongation factor P hydroxylase [Legionella jordanis]
MHDYRDLISIFNDCFSKTFNTQLLKGEDEPIYLPADDHRPFHAIYFAHGFFSSALHECAHWLIAGQERRQKIDYGYWYEPDGRNAKQQELFQRVEAKPQALEWILSVAAGYRFRISIDNLNGPALDTDAFRKNIYREVKNYCQQGLPERARMFRAALCDFYGNSQELAIEYFKIEDL